ncbi:PilZ domain-containing protein [Hyphomicrobium sp.]|uniref:PilZ domain-containing protein n=1 Tax=Hyphomicrobium sp. TaxID=82 RepID=UPI0025C652D3|nr:PilZ domain-containing protein [Hyphomicrobium sp.]MCC7253873.1 PilZ domain-containing protein [Hyphomicrobium sp.]
MATKDSRRTKRRRTNNAGILRTGEKEFAVLLRDASQTGARVRLVIPCDVPEQVTLVSSMEKINAACTVVWRRGNDLGLRFN